MYFKKKCSPLPPRFAPAQRPGRAGADAVAWRPQRRSPPSPSGCRPTPSWGACAARPTTGRSTAIDWRSWWVCVALGRMMMAAVMMVGDNVQLMLCRLVISERRFAARRLEGDTVSNGLRRGEWVMARIARSQLRVVSRLRAAGKWVKKFVFLLLLNQRNGRQKIKKERRFYFTSF